MLDEKKVQEAMQSGLAFICASCVHWHEGVERDLKDLDNDTVCTKNKTCFSPLSGGSFDQYSGPMQFCLMRFCYSCGKEADKALEAQVGGARKIGICNKCLEKIVRQSAVRAPGKKILFTTENRTGPPKYDEVAL